MDGYVLPSFESTSIFKDKDVIGVRRKDYCISEGTETEDERREIQDSEVTDKQLVVTSKKCLAIKDIEERDYTVPAESPVGENANSQRKRKRSNVPQGSKSKKLKPTSLEEQDRVGKDAENNHREEAATTRKSSRKKDKSSKRDEKRMKGLKPPTHENQDGANVDAESNHIEGKTGTRKSTRRRGNASEGDKVDALVSSQDDDSDEKIHSPREIRNDQEETNGQPKICEPQVNDTEKKLPSRSARRKKAKRQWHRENPKQQREERTVIDVPANDIHTKPLEHERINLNHIMEDENAAVPLEDQRKVSQVPANNIHAKSLEREGVSQNNVTEDENAYIPVEDRPGHIRFEPIDAGQSKAQSNGKVESLQWNGITSKRKGQQWGREKATRRNYYSACDEGTYETGRNNGEAWQNNGEAWDYGTNETTQSNGHASNEGTDEKSIARDVNQVDDKIDYSCFHPISRPPKVDDVIAYRVVELNSSWCPELSSYRVGKVSLFDSISMRLVLIPVPGYPFYHDVENPELQTDVSVLNEDGSLEINYLSLVDVRLVSANCSEETSVSTLQQETTEKTAPASNLNVASLHINVTQASAPVNNWEVAAANISAQEKSPPVVAANISAQEKSPPVVQVDKFEAAVSKLTQEKSPTDAPVNNWAAENVKPTDKSGRIWGDISQAITDKKAELQKNNDWGKWQERRKDPIAPPPAYINLRRIAGRGVGPTMRRLRESMGNYGNRGCYPGK